MTMRAPLMYSTVLTPKMRERDKTAQQKAEDVIYTLNHTFTCLTLTDMVIVPALRGLGMNIGHSHGGAEHDHQPTIKYDVVMKPPAEKSLGDIGHDGCNDPTHGHGPAKKKGLFSGLSKKKETPTTIVYSSSATHEGHDHPPKDAPFMKKAGHWLVGEAIGDIGAALVTIPIQRYLPGVMDAARAVMEPTVGGFFHRGAQRASRTWADKHGLDYNSEEVVSRAETLYHYEMQHLPQMAVWTATSIGLHYGAMRFMEKDITVGEFARMKAAGAGITALTVFGARAVAPDKAHAWDQTAGKHVVIPLTKSVGKLFGVKEHDVDAYHERQSEDTKPQSWAAKVNEPTPAMNLVRGV